MVLAGNKMWSKFSKSSKIIQYYKARQVMKHPLSDARGRSALQISPCSIHIPPYRNRTHDTLEHIAFHTVRKLPLRICCPAAFLSIYILLVGARDLRPLWSPPVSLNLVHVLVFFRNFKLFYFFIFIIILYNKNKVFLFHFYIYIYLNASLKFGERKHTSFFFK
jgi:hypothetical protein